MMSLVLLVNLLLYVAVLVNTQGTATLGLSDGLSTFNTEMFTLQVVNASQTLYSLRAKNGGTFDFIPYDKMTQRQYNGNYHLGDITYRVREVGATAWTSGDTAAARKAVTVLKPADASTLAAADLTPTLPADAPVNITRRWRVEGSRIQLLFDVKNVGSSSLEIGAIGAPLEFNNMFTDRTAADTNANCSVFDPYIGQDAGYVQVTPLLGTLPPLVVTPLSGSPMEGWRFLTEATADPPYYQSQTFEGLYEWSWHTLAYAQNEWNAAAPWNAPTSAVLLTGHTRTYGLQFQLAASIRGIDDALIAAGRPVAVGIPGYIVPRDATSKLFLRYASAVQSVVVSPSGSLAWKSNTDAQTAAWAGYDITPGASAWGRARLTITYADGLNQTVHYYITKSGPSVLSDLGAFLTTNQWFDNATDPFARSPSVLTYDRQANALVKDEARAWIAGLSDEAGAGSWLAATVKQYAQPNEAEVKKLETFVNKTLFGSIQNTDGKVKKSVYYYDPATQPSYPYPTSINYGNWWSWNKANAWATDRAYDYVHVTAAYWSLYRVARNYPSLSQTTWSWYLSQAVLTITAMLGGGVGYTDVGLMGETVFVMVLSDLKREGWTSQASTIESLMLARAKVWSTQSYPFGSEMAWDSTGQEGVYAWSRYFNYTSTAQNTLNSIIAYQPTLPHWGYNGNARRYWDNIYGGKLQRLERQIHHYGSGLNALPLVAAYREAGTDTYLLRAGIGGLSGALSNVDQDGFAAASFHAFPDTLAWDAYSGDYGPNFVGHALGTGTFVLNHPDFGWQAFGGTVVARTATGVTVDVRDSVRRRVYVASLKAMFTLDAGVFATVIVDGGSVQLTVLAKPPEVAFAAAAPQGRLVVEGSVTPTTSMKTDAGAFIVPFTSGTAVVSFVS